MGNVDFGAGRIRTCRWSLVLLIGSCPVLIGQQTDVSKKPTGRAEPISTTLCAIVRHPGRFDGKLVRLHAWFKSDGLEYSVLTEPRCAKGIVPYPPVDQKQRPSYEAFERALDWGLRSTRDKNVDAVFVGYFHWKPGSTRIIELEEVLDLHVTRRKDFKEKPLRTPPLLESPPPLEHEGQPAIVRERPTQ